MAFRSSGAVIVWTIALVFGGATVAPALPFLEFQLSALENSLVLVEVSVNADDGANLSLAVSALVFEGQFNEVLAGDEHDQDVDTTSTQDFLSVFAPSDDYHSEKHLDTFFYTRTDEWRDGLPDCSSIDPTGVVHVSATRYQVCLGTGANSTHNILKLANLVVPEGTTITFIGSIARQDSEQAVSGSILAVPEPTTHALLLGAFGLVMAIERRARLHRS